MSGYGVGHCLGHTVTQYLQRMYGTDPTRKHKFSLSSLFSCRDCSKHSTYHVLYFSSSTAGLVQQLDKEP